MKKKVTIGFPVAVGILSYLGVYSAVFCFAALAVVIVFGLYLQYSSR